MTSIGRNDRCSCGSGKKYKYCCLGLKTSGAAACQEPARRPAFDVPGALSLAFEQFQAGELDQAEKVFRRIVQVEPGHGDAWYMLGAVASHRGEHETAVGLVRKALETSPGNLAYLVDLGILLNHSGRGADAEEHFRRALKRKPGTAELLFQLGSTLQLQGRFAEAEACFRQVLVERPDYPEAHRNLGGAQNELGLLDAAEASYRRALEINPGSAAAQLSLGNLLYRIGGRDDEALAALERSVQLNPDDADALLSLGIVLMRGNQVARSMAMFRHSQQLRPLITRPSRNRAEFSVLLLDAPNSGSTPIGYLIGGASYDSHFYCVLPGEQRHLELLRAKADVVVNLIADADEGSEVLPLALDLVERLGLPTVNHPAAVRHTGRESVARRLAGIPLCRIPGTVRLAGPVLAEATRNRCLEGLTMPLLARPVGNHGGERFEKFFDLDAMLDFVSVSPDVDYYLTEFVDCRSADGFYRKYRLISVAGELLPYHLAIHDDWKVHHFRTDMANQAWMRQEEEAFLIDPSLVLGAPQLACLRAVAAATGLDYGGIDCALDRDGNIVVFESNAVMLVHDENEGLLAYKNLYISRIKEAFNAMLARLAQSGKLCHSQSAARRAGGTPLAPETLLLETCGGVFPVAQGGLR